MAHRTRVRGAAALAALALSVPMLTACGPKATSRPYTPAAGVNALDTGVAVLNAVIVAPEAGSGNLVATLANRSPDEPAALVSVSSTGEPVAQVEAGELEIPAAAAVNLADAGGLAATGDYELGQFVPLSFTFDTSEGTQSIDVEVVVVPDQGDYAGLGGGTAETLPDEVESSSETDHSADN